MHAQSIMQSALIKKKLEEQRENFRKRQDQQQQQQQAHHRASSPVNSPAKQTMSPTPLAFTPTSVLRKMTADKEPEGANQSNHQFESNFLFSSTINENRNNKYRNAFNFKKSTDTQKFASYDNAIQLTNHNVKKHGNISGIDASKNLHELNNNSNVGIEESALKDKYSSPLQQEKDTNNNSSQNMTEENKHTYETKESLNENTPSRESNAMDRSDSNNNSPLILDRLFNEQFEIDTIIVDNNQMLGKTEENKILNSQNDEVVT